SAPVIRRRKSLPRERRVGGCFIPADAGYRHVSFAIRERTELPGCRTRAAGLIAELRHGVFPGQRAPALDEWLLPEVAHAVAAVVDERLELAIRDLELVDPEIFHRCCRRPERRRRRPDSDHALKQRRR